MNRAKMITAKTVYAAKPNLVVGSRGKQLEVNVNVEKADVIALKGGAHPMYLTLAERVGAMHSGSVNLCAKERDCRTARSVMVGLVRLPPRL